MMTRTLRPLLEKLLQLDFQIVDAYVSLGFDPPQDYFAGRIHAETAGTVDKRSDRRIILYRPASLCSDRGRLRLEWVATSPWSTWQASCGLGGSFPMDWVAGFMWTEWQPSHGLGGRYPWNMQECRVERLLAALAGRTARQLLRLCGTSVPASKTCESGW